MSSTHPENWQEVKEIFCAALRLTPAEREQFLNESCKDDEDLRSEVESMLASSDAAGSFMQNPAVGEIAEVFAEIKEKLQVNQNLSHYKILKLLSAGGMGEVYLAQDTRLERKVALKILPAAFARDRGRMRRFLLEAKTVSALNHPHILTIYETGEMEKTNYIVSEYVEGETLSERLLSKPLNPGSALDIAAQIASALEAAHGANIVHRDIKPDNVMIRPDGFVKILDFGIAKLLESAPLIDAEAATAIKAGTIPGMIIGTANYMSPEQAKGEAVDARSDIFSFGAVLYEMLTGKKAFAGASPMETIALILHKEPAPLTRLVPDAPLEIERIAGKALRKNREERYQTAKDLLIDLKDTRAELEFQNKLDRTVSPNREEPKTQSFDRTTKNVAHTSSSAEYIVGEVKKHKPGFVVLSVLLLAAIGVSFWSFSNRPTVARQIESIAIMPFVNARGNADTEYLSDGLTETLISSLSQLPNLNVKARSSVFRYKGKDTDAATIARELNVQAILTGKIVEQGQNLSLYVEFIDVAADKVIWSQTYNRQMTNLVALQSEVARDVSGNLQTKLSGADMKALAKNYTGNAEAYQLYLKGNYAWNKHTQEDLQKAIEYYNQAIEKDPTFALAYAGISASYGVLGDNYLPPNEAFPKAKAYAAKALEIDNTLSEAHMSMGAVRLYYDWDWTEAAKEIERAQALDSNNPTAHHLHGDLLEIMGRFDEAQAERKRSLEFDPLSPLFNWVIGATLYFAGYYDAAIAQLEKAINLEPHYSPAYFQLGQAFEQKKMYARAIATYQKGIAQTERSPQLIAALGHAYALNSERDKAQKSLDELREISKQHYVSPYLFAFVYLGLGDKDQTFAWLDKAYQDRSSLLIWLKVEPQFDSLHDDKRYRDLFRRIGLQM